MSITSYSTLVTAVGNWLNRTDLDSYIPEFVQLAEARFNRTLRTPDMLTTASTTSSSEIIALPSDFLAMQSLYIDSDPDIVLEAMAYSAMRETWAVAQTGRPVAYAVQGRNMVIAPAPDGSYTYKLAYYASVPALSTNRETNWLIEQHPDLYLYATLCMAQGFITDPERLNQWRNAWDEATEEVIRHGNAQRLPSSPLAMRPTVWE